MRIREIPEGLERAVDNLKSKPLGKNGLQSDHANHSLRTDGVPAVVDSEYLIQHMMSTYRLLRRGMGWLAISFPFSLVLIGLLFFKVGWQPSISDYYFALPQDVALPNGCLVANATADCAIEWSATARDMVFPMRSFFAGGLISIGVFLILYKGTSWLEDWALNFAGLFAIGVAIFPMNKAPFYTFWPTWWHFASAVMLFICMWFISRYCAKDTLVFFKDGSSEVVRYRRLYKYLSWGMLAVLIVGGIYGLNAEEIDRYFPWALFFIEAVGVIIFGSYWVMKSKEISSHKFGEKSA